MYFPRGNLERRGINNKALGGIENVDWQLQHSEDMV